MKKQTTNLTYAALLRQKAEEQLKSKQSKTSLTFSETDLLRLIHELEVHQIELEMQNEEFAIAKEKAELAEKKYTELYDFAPSGYFTLSRQGIILEMKLRGAQMLGKERSLLKNSHFGFFVNDESRSVFVTFLEEIFQGKNNAICDVPLNCSDNSSLYVHFTGIVSENREQCHLTAIDITERKKADDLRKNIAKYKVLIDNFPVAITISDPGGNIIETNEKALELLGLSREEHLKRKLRGEEWKIIRPDGTVFPPDEYASVKALKENRLVENVEMGTVKSGGEITWLNVTAVPIPIEDFGVVIAYNDITERKQAEEEIKRTGQHYQALIEKAPDGIVLIDAEGNFKYISPSAKKMFGYNQTDVVSGNPAKHTHPDDLKMVVSELAKIFEDPSHVPTLEYRFIDKLGHWHWVETTFRNLLANPSVESIVLNFRDITERKRSEQIIRLSEEKFRKAFFTSPDSININRLEDGMYISINKGFTQTMGYTEEEVLGKTSIELKIWAKTDDRKKLSDELKLKGYVENLETKFRKKDGTLVDGLMSASIIELEGVPHILSITRNITERKQVETELRNSEERYALVIEASEQGIWDWNVETNEVFYSEQWKKQIGYKDQELKNEFYTWVEHLHPDEKEYCQNAVLSYLKQPVSHLILDFRFRHKDGTYRWIHNKAASIKNIEGKVIRLFGTHTDFTEIKFSEAIFKDIIEKNPMSIQILDMEGYPIQVNPAHTKLFGVKTPSDFSVLKDPQLLSHGFGKLFKRIKKGEVVYFPDSYYNVHDVDPSFPDSPVWVRALGFTLNDINGNPNKIVFMHENITERKNAEALLNDIIEKNPMSIQVVDKEGHTLRGNTAFIQLFGSVPPPEFSIFDDLKGKSAELENLVSKVKNGEIVHLPDVYFNAHEAVEEAPDIPLWIRALIFPLNDSIGKPERFVFMHENITESKIAEQELIKAKERAEESEKKFREMAELLPQIVFETDIEGNLTYVNKYAYKMTGYSEQDSIIGKSTLDFYIPEDRKRALQNIKMRFTGGKIIESNEYTMIHKDGSTFNILVYSNPIFKDSKPVGLRGIIVDISELKQTEQELVKAKLHAEESDRLKSAFLANMSHEIRTPMNGILGFSGLLKEPGLSGDQQQKYIRIIEKSGERMLNVINDIVDISKIEAGLMNVIIQDTDINEKIDFINIFFKPQVEEKGMQLLSKKALPTKEAIIRTDNEKVYSVLTNLVKNAIKFSEEGSIEFGYERKGNNIEFFVKDTGIGIPKARQEAIFERFIQADISDKMARQGAGLGLAISKAYVEMLGGKIWVESEECIGSTFYFTLPYNALSEEVKVVGKIVQPPDKENQVIPEVSGLKILIAEDDETSELLISIEVGKFSKKVLKAGTGIEAVEFCRNNPDTDLILMDIQMPGMNGYEATRQIRQFNKEVVIIAQTAFGLYGDREKAIEAGCNDYISKPINKTELEALIQKYFGK